MSPGNEIESKIPRVMTCGPRGLRASVALAATLCCATVALAAGCGLAEDEVSAADISVDGGNEPPSVAAGERAALASEPAAGPQGFRVPVDFRPECEYLRMLPEPPADLDLAQFYACLTDESFDALDGMYRTSRKVDSRTPSLAAFAAAHGRTLVRDRLRQRGEAWSRFTPGTPPTDVVDRGLAFRTVTPFGLDPLTHCTSGSCLSASVSVVEATRTIGYRPAVTQGGLNPGSTPGDTSWRTRRFPDGIDYGTHPSARQGSLADAELRAAGCGPIAGINLFDWWNIPIVDGSGRELTNLDERAAFMAGCMGTLDGMNFTDDEELFACLDGHMADMQRRGFMLTRPGSYVAMGDRAEFKRLMHEVSLGHPAIALYATGSDTMHWALVTGFVDDQVRFANGSPMSLARFYAEWDNWESLGWFADIFVGTAVDPDTFYVLTGFGANPQPARFAPRTSTTSLPAYASGTARHAFRYCLPDTDVLGSEAERPHLATWPAEPNATTGSGYCLFNSPQASFELQTSVHGGIAIDTALRNFIIANPGALGHWWGFDAAGSATQFHDVRLHTFAASANIPTPVVGASITELQFIVHTRDFAQLRRPIGDFASRRPLFFYDAAARTGYTSSISAAGAYASCGALSGFGTWTHVAGAANGTLFFYNSSTGAAYVSRVDAPCAYASVRAVTGVAPGFTHVVAANQGGLFFYNASTRTGATAVVDSAGRYTYRSGVNGLGQFTHVAGTSGGGLFMYNAANGTAFTARLNAAGDFIFGSSLAGLATGWTHVVGANTGSLFFYNAGNGTGATARLDAAGVWHHVSVLSGFGTWSKIAGASNGGILFYSTSGSGYTGVIDAAGNYRTVSPLSGFGGTWSNIVAL